MSYSLNTTTINTLSKEKPKNAVILCHGYGGDGKDISLLANYWKTYLPETIFFCPDAPEKCAVSPTGFQWFDLMDQSQDQILSKSIVAESLPTGVANGNVITASTVSDTRKWLISNNQKRIFPTLQTFWGSNYAFSELVSLPLSEINKIPDGDPID